MLRDSVKKVMNDVTFKENSRKVGESLRNAGGYNRAVDEIFKMKMNSYSKLK